MHYACTCTYKVDAQCVHCRASRYCSAAVFMWMVGCLSAAVTVQFTSANYQVNEGDGTVQVCLMKNVVTATSFNVTVMTQPDSACE